MTIEQKELMYDLINDFIKEFPTEAASIGSRIINGFAKKNGVETMNLSTETYKLIYEKK